MFVVRINIRYLAESFSVPVLITNHIVVAAARSSALSDPRFRADATAAVAAAKAATGAGTASTVLCLFVCFTVDVYAI